MLISIRHINSWIKIYFNTSHVNVNLRRLQNYLQLYLNFNTSHVNVNQQSPRPLQQMVLYFNTSHVNVNRMPRVYWPRRGWISIHLMLMLILLILSCVHPNILNFNTSHVNVNPVHYTPVSYLLFHFNTSHVNVNPEWI